MGCPPCDYCNGWPGRTRYKDDIEYDIEYDIEDGKIVDFICSRCIKSEKKDRRIFIGFRKVLDRLYDRAIQAEEELERLKIGNKL